MTQAKGAIFVGMVVIAAFFWGYGKERIQPQVKELPQQPALSSQDKEIQKPKVVAKPPAPIAPLANNPKPKFSADRPYQSVPNPYQRFMRQIPNQNQGSLGGALDAIRPGTDSQPQKVTRRNAYFEKLRDQLRELRGEAENRSDPGPKVTQPSPSAKSPGKLTSPKSPPSADSQDNQEPEAETAADANEMAQPLETEEVIDPTAVLIDELAAEEEAARLEDEIETILGDELVAQ